MRMNRVGKKCENSQCFFHRIRLKIIAWIGEQRIIMTIGKYPRLFITFLIYVGEFFLLLYSIQLLSMNVLELTPFSSFLKLEPIKRLFDFLYGLPFVQSVDRFAVLIAPKISENTAAGELIGAIGAGGMFITLLTGAEEQRICGVRTGELLGWLHKFFFKAYVLLFLPLVSVGIYAGHAQKGKATVYAFLGVFLGVLLILLACIELVLSAAWREQLALQYYNWQLHLGLMSRLRIWIWQKIGFGLSEADYTKRAMLNLANYTRSQTEEYHRDVSLKMVFLWIQSCRVPNGTDIDYPDCDLDFEEKLMRNFPDKDSCNISQENGLCRFKCVNSGFQYPEDYLSDGEDCIINHAFLAIDVWNALLPGPTLSEQDLTIIRQTLYSLYYISQPDKRRFIILLGLLFCLEDKSTDKDIELVAWVDAITQRDTNICHKDGAFCEAKHDLVWALLMIRTITWVQDGTITKRRNYISQFRQRFGTVLFQQDEADSAYIRNEATLLWYAEWAARKRCGLSLNRYLAGISTIFGEKNVFPYVPVNTFTYRKRLLVQILTIIYFWWDMPESDLPDKEEGVDQQ